VLFLQTGLARDSGGVGRHRGGLAPETLCVPYGADSWDVTVFQNRMSTPSSAVSGGSPGAGAAICFARGIMPDVLARLRRYEELPVDEYALHAEHPPARARGFQVGSEDGYYIRATGGPGYGDPLEREPEAVLADVLRGFVSPRLAEDAYGVALTGAGAGDDLSVDLDATVALRAKVRESRRSCPPGAQVLPVGDGSGGRPQEHEPLAGNGEQVLGECLAIDAEGFYHCRRCNQRLAANTTNWKWWALCSVAHVEPSVIHNTIVVRRAGDLMFRRYHSPGCAVQIDSEVAVVGEPPRWTYRPLGVEPGP
jgi:N-methylhydantoinase B